MAGFYLVPIHLAVPLAVLILALTPRTPHAGAWIACTTLARAVRRRDAPIQIVKTLSRQILLALVLPWAAITLLTAMICIQLLITPLSLAFHLRNLEHTLARLSTRLPASPPPPLPEDLTTLPKYTFTPLPSPEATAAPTIRLLTLHPSPSWRAPLCGSITTAELTPNLTYDALSYTWYATDEASPAIGNGNGNGNVSGSRSGTGNGSGNGKGNGDGGRRGSGGDNEGGKAANMQNLLVLNPDTRKWTALPITANCAAALRRVRRRGGGERRVWVDQVCVSWSAVER